MTSTARAAGRQLIGPHFELTDAIRPGPGQPPALRQGYRIQRYSNRTRRLCIPVLCAGVSRPQLFETFLALLAPLGSEVDVVLETSHNTPGGHGDLRRKGMDRPVLESYCCEFEDFLLSDGMTGLAVIATHEAMEVQFDEHKLLVCYAHNLKPFRAILRQAGIERDDSLPVVCDAPHWHFSQPNATRQFAELAWRLGVGQPERQWNADDNPLSV